MRDLITREIGIDAAHRIPDHHSKCRNVHGHRYVIQASCSGDLHQEGSQAGMILDFAFLKEEMINCIDIPCDHGTLLWENDPIVSGILPFLGKYILLPCIPTAENLARYWFNLLEQRILLRSENKAFLARIRVFETPNCWADYSKE